MQRSIRPWTCDTWSCVSWGWGSGGQANWGCCWPGWGAPLAAGSGECRARRALGLSEGARLCLLLLLLLPLHGCALVQQAEDAGGRAQEEEAEAAAAAPPSSPHPHPAPCLLYCSTGLPRSGEGRGAQLLAALELARECAGSGACCCCGSGAFDSMADCKQGGRVWRHALMSRAAAFPNSASSSRACIYPVYHHD